jgi:tRNA (guanine26-N2/guanine27-N2)-dimethyltransferase
VYQCFGCDSFHIQPLGKFHIDAGGTRRSTWATGPVVPQNCSECGRGHQVSTLAASHTAPLLTTSQIGGPVWGGPIHNAAFLDKLLASFEEAPAKDLHEIRRLRGLVGMARAELEDCPLYYSLPSLCRTVHVTVPSLAVFK